MAKGPKGERRPADVIGNAVKVMRIATGQEPEDYGPTAESEGKNAAAVALGRMGGKTRASSLSKKQRSEIARIINSIHKAAMTPNVIEYPI